VTAPSPHDPGKSDEGAGAPTVWETVKSVNAAFIGVQNRKNRERDFTKGKASHFIVIGIIMTALFIGAVLLIVKLTLRNAGL
jgi:hypothetical protein